MRNLESFFFISSVKIRKPEFWGKNELSFGENGLSFAKKLSFFGPEFFAKWTKKA